MRLGLSCKFNYQRIKKFRCLSFLVSKITKFILLFTFTSHHLLASAHPAMENLHLPFSGLIGESSQIRRAPAISPRNSPRDDSISERALVKDLRIVSLAPNLTEIIYALGLGKNLVGNTSQCDYPDEAKFVYKVGDYINPNIERILNTKPNYVLATIGNPRSILNKLEFQGIKIVEVSDPTAVDELPVFIQKIANALGVQSEGHRVAGQISQAIKQLKSYKKIKKSFLLVIQFEPIYTASNKTWLGNLFTLAGYSNVVSSSKISYPVVPQEYLIRNKPDIVFTWIRHNLTVEENKQLLFVHLEKIFGSKEAKKIEIIFLPEDILTRAGPRIIDGIHFIGSLSR